MPDLKSCSDLELLAELLTRNTLFDAPTKRTYAVPHYEAVLGIGNDNTAHLTLDAEALEAMEALVPGVDVVAHLQLDHGTSDVERIDDYTQRLPRWQCHKIVGGVHIAQMELHDDGSATITSVEEGVKPFTTRPGWTSTYHGNGNDLGVYVEYENGYTSWSPTASFDAGYTRL